MSPSFCWFNQDLINHLTKLLADIWSHKSQSWIQCWWLVIFYTSLQKEKVLKVTKVPFLCPTPNTYLSKTLILINKFYQFHHKFFIKPMNVCQERKGERGGKTPGEEACMLVQYWHYFKADMEGGKSSLSGWTRNRETHIDFWYGLESRSQLPFPSPEMVAIITRFSGAVWGLVSFALCFGLSERTKICTLQNAVIFSHCLSTLS